MNVEADKHEIEVLCDRCGQSTRASNGELQFASLNVSWGQGAKHAGEAYELHLCEPCFFGQLAGLKRDRWTLAMFTSEADAIREDAGFGRVPTADRNNE
ncbi:hypothetical protein N1E91_12085 [Pseudomonas aeruginosa]|nr:hypothetical protein [Pseudomonas aeruginosa]MCS9139186.1 hypothetical protein [Pseudomonas aeruginosa]MCS9211833.1 hypothetical protein [Pseudomonas aeruginosa]